MPAFLFMKVSSSGSSAKKIFSTRPAVADIGVQGMPWLSDGLAAAHEMAVVCANSFSPKHDAPVTQHTPGRMETRMALVNWMSRSCLNGGYLPSSCTFTMACRARHKAHEAVATVQQCTFGAAELQEVAW